MKELIIPRGTTVVEGHAKENFQCLRFSDTVTRLENCAFMDCIDLEIVYWGSNIVFAGHKIFYNCKKIKKVYANSEEDFFNYICDNFGSPLQYGADLYIGDKLCTEITIPRDLRCIEGLYNFLGCGSIKKFKVWEDTPCYKEICAMIEDINNNKDKFRHFTDGDIQDIELEVLR